jgi:hypothetical protein
MYEHTYSGLDENGYGVHAPDCEPCQRSKAKGPYKIVRHYMNGNPNSKTIRRGLTLAEAQEHCKDPETSSSTARKAAGRTRTRQLGPWFDGYTEDRD